MSGKPAARIGDKVAKGKIVTGSATVLIGDAAEGAADKCPVCAPQVGWPVNPIVGAKLLPAETDFALPAPAPFVFARSYLSRDARIGSLGQGWSLPGEGLGLEAGPEATVLIDAQGRRLTFGALAPGEARFSPTESLWLRRAGPVVPQADAGAPWSGRWAAVPEPERHGRDSYFLQAGGQYFHFAPCAGRHRLVARFDRNGYRTAFEWHPDGFLAGVTDSAGRHYRFAYRPFSSRRAGDPGVRLAGVALAEAPGGLIDPDSQADWLVRYEFDAAGALVAVFDRTGAARRRFAWREHLMIAQRTPGGLEVAYTWDRLHPEGRVVRQAEAGGLVRAFAYHAGHTVVTDSLGRTETYHFEGDGRGPDTRWRAHTRADGSELRFHYDGFGRRIATEDPLGRLTRSRLDGQGRLVGLELPDASRWDYRLDPDTDEVLEVRGPEGLAWHIERDPCGNPLTVTAPDGAVTRYAYADPQLPDRPTALTDPAGGVQRLEWNRAGQLTAHTDCAGRTRRYRYDAEGRLVAETDPAGATTRHRTDRLGRRIETERADGTRLAYAWDGADRLVGLTRPDGSTEELAWDTFGRLTAHTDAAGHSRRLAYDAAGRLLTLENENGATTRFAYDAMDRLVEERGFDARTQHYEYDAAGQLVARTEASLAGEPVTRYQYDALGRLVERTLPATAHAPAITETFAWRADGQLAGFQNPAAGIRFGFDAAGRPTRETQTHADGWTYHVAHRHGPRGELTQSTWGTAPALDWLTYGPGHLHGARAAGLALDFERDVLHRETVRRAAPGEGEPPVLTEARSYTPLGLLERQRYFLGADQPAVGHPTETRYTYDLLGRLTGRADPARPEAAIGYTYDDADRLVASRHGAAAHHYTFDPAGNRTDAPAGPPHRLTQAEWAELVQSRLHDPSFNPLAELGFDGSHEQRWFENRITQLAGTTSQFDAAGNLVARTRADGTRLTLGYDGAHRLVALERRDPDGATTRAQYTYDALSRRIAKTVTGPDGAEATTRYGWDGERLVAEANERSTTTVVYEPGSFVPLVRFEQAADAQDDEAEAERALRQTALALLAAHDLPIPEGLAPVALPASASLYVTDHLGTPLRLIGARGETLWQASPDDWGAVRDERGSTRQPIRFQGQWADEESGLYYNRYRYYDPEQGRYVTQDPIGLDGGANAYAYALNLPSTSYDPLGLLAPLVVIGVMALIGGSVSGVVNYGKQKASGKCSIDSAELANAVAWGGIAGAAMPVLGTTTVGAALVGGAAGLGQYTTGSVLTGEELTLSGAAINTGMGAVGGGMGGRFNTGTWYGMSKTAWPELAYKQTVNKQIQRNTTPQTIGQSLGGNVIGNVDPASPPCLGCQRTCN